MDGEKTSHDEWLYNIDRTGRPGPPPSLMGCRQPTQEERRQIDDYAGGKDPNSGVLWEYFWRLKARQVLGPEGDQGAEDANG